MMMGMTLRQIARDTLGIKLSYGVKELSAVVTPQSSKNQIRIERVEDSKNPYQFAA